MFGPTSQITKAGDMPKVVVNSCWGGFGISKAGMLRYAQLKGITLYPEQGSFGTTTWWTVPEDQRVEALTGEAWRLASPEARATNSQAWNAQTISVYDLVRDDPALVQVVEELGDAAADHHAELRIAEVPDDVKWTIEEYDGKEWVAEVHRTW